MGPHPEPTEVLGDVVTWVVGARGFSEMYPPARGCIRQVLAVLVGPNP